MQKQTDQENKLEKDLKCAKKFLFYCGGKVTLSSFIANIIRHYEFTTYVEPFVGAGSVYIALKQDARPRGTTWVINDVDDTLITFYRVLKQNPEALLKELDSCLYSETLSKKALTVLKEPQQHSDLQIAWAKYYAHATGYMARATSFARDTRRLHSLPNAVRHLISNAELLRECVILNEDYSKCIQRFDSKETLFYCDPPYPKTSQHYGFGAFGFTDSNFKELLDVILSSKGQGVISCCQHNIPEEYRRFFDVHEKPLRTLPPIRKQKAARIECVLVKKPLHSSAL